MADFTTVMTAVADVDNSVIELMDQAFIIAQAPEAVMDQFVTLKEDIGAKSIEFPKYAQLALATSALAEKEDIASVALSDSQIILTPAEYGNVVTTTKLASLQTGGKVDLAAAQLVGMNAQRSLDKLACLAAEAGTNTLTVDGGAIADLTAGDVMTTTYLNIMYNKLKRAGIMPMVDGMFVACMHSDVLHDLRNSTGAGSWQDISKYQKSETVLRNEVGTLCGFRIVENNNLTIFDDAGAGAVDVYKPLFMGFNALGKAVSSPLTQKITGPFDKLGRFMNVGWHACVQYKIVDQDAIWVGACASSIGANT